MIKVYYMSMWEHSSGEYCQMFSQKEKALRFIYMMRKKGYLITGWVCEDKFDHEWLERRVK